jgi:hypothetical protein
MLLGSRDAAPGGVAGQSPAWVAGVARAKFSVVEKANYVPGFCGR